MNTRPGSSWFPRRARSFQGSPPHPRILMRMRSGAGKLDAGIRLAAHAFCLFPFCCDYLFTFSSRLQLHVPLVGSFLYRWVAPSNRSLAPTTTTSLPLPPQRSFLSYDACPAHPSCKSSIWTPRYIRHPTGGQLEPFVHINKMRPRRMAETGSTCWAHSRPSIDFMPSSPSPELNLKPRHFSTPLQRPHLKSSTSHPSSSLNYNTQNHTHQEPP